MNVINIVKVKHITSPNPEQLGNCSAPYALIKEARGLIKYDFTACYHAYFKANPSRVITPLELIAINDNQPFGYQQGKNDIASFTVAIKSYANYVPLIMLLLRQLYPTAVLEGLAIDPLTTITSQLAYYRCDIDDHTGRQDLDAHIKAKYTLTIKSSLQKSIISTLVDDDINKVFAIARSVSMNKRNVTTKFYKRVLTQRIEDEAINPLKPNYNHSDDYHGEFERIYIRHLMLNTLSYYINKEVLITDIMAAQYMDIVDHINDYLPENVQNVIAWDELIVPIRDAIKSVAKYNSQIDGVEVNH